MTGPALDNLFDANSAKRAIRARLTDLARDGGPMGPHVISSAIDWYERKTGQFVPRAHQKTLMQALGQEMAQDMAPDIAQDMALGRDMARGHDTATGQPAGAQGDDTTAVARFLPAFAKRLNSLTRQILPEAMALLDMRELGALPQDQQRAAIRDAVLSVGRAQKLELNGAESAELVRYVVDDMMGFGPLERLLADDDVSDIMVNGPHRIYIERNGQLQLSDVSFRDDQHVINIATRIVSMAGRRVDETTPMVDARLPDGSRINVTIPPLALDGPTMTIRKFPKDELTFADLVARNSLSPRMAEFLRLAARMRLNILISGGTGSGKTTLLNAISKEISAKERIVTIEDAAELRLQQPHVVRLETRPPTIEGVGEITMRHLFRNSLRMRPDRIIIGEVRSDEALDLLQAMNTGHDGSMSTLHANNPREALTRMENMIAMSGVRLSPDFVRHQLKDAIHLIVQISRMRDGVRRVVSVSEVVGFEGNVITMQELFRFQQSKGRTSDHVEGRFEVCGNTPHFMDRATEQGLEAALRATLEEGG